MFTMSVMLSTEQLIVGSFERNNNTQKGNINDHDVSQRKESNISHNMDTIMVNTSYVNPPTPASASENGSP